MTVGIDLRQLPSFSSLAPSPGDPTTAIHADAIARGARVPRLATLRLLEWVIRQHAIVRSFEIGVGHGHVGRIMLDAAGPTATYYGIEPHHARAVAARETFAAAGHQERANVLVGDLARFVHKVAGPFDLIVYHGAPLLSPPFVARLVTLLQPGGLLFAETSLLDSDALITPDARTACVSSPHFETAWWPDDPGVTVSRTRVTTP